MRVSISVFALMFALVALPVSATARGNAPARGDATARVPQGFVGMTAGDLFFPGVNPQSQLGLMVSSGVESLQIGIDWASTEPSPGVYNWSSTDQAVGLAAEHGLTLLPVVANAPLWDGSTPRSHPDWQRIPTRTAPFATFMKALVHRYGPRGTFWAENPTITKVPIRMWTIWNEPNFPFGWYKQPFERSYVTVLRAAHAAIKSADPGAKVVLAGLPNFAWQTLAQIYKVPGARDAFDVVNAHSYTATPGHVIEFLQLVRAVMNRAGDTRKPIIVGEFGWPSSLGKTTTSYNGIATTVAGQARKVAAVLPMLGSHRKALRLLSIYYYDWIGNDNPFDAFNFSGLLELTYPAGQLRAKPALAAFRRGALALEDCRQKASVATRCLRLGR